MPCYDGGPGGDDRRLISKADHIRLKKTEAILCGIFSTMNPSQLQDLFEKVDWEEVGTTQKWAKKWWIEHQKEDEERRKRQAAKLKAERLKKKALSKLTPREKTLLGIKD